MTDGPSALTRRAVLRAITGGGALAASVAACSACGIARSGVPGFGAAGSDAVDSTVTSGVAAAGTVVMIIRHGEKPDGSDKGFDPSGKTDKSSLTRAGYARASRLVDVFDPARGRPRPGLARPRVIFAAGANDDGEGKRTRETIAPLAARLSVAVNTSFGKGEEDALVARIVSQPGPTLVCWQHGEIPAIAAAFGNVSPAPPDSWPDERYDMIWTLTASPGGWHLAQIPEMLMPGDQGTVIDG